MVSVLCKPCTILGQELVTEVMCMVLSTNDARYLNEVF